MRGCVQVLAARREDDAQLLAQRPRFCCEHVALHAGQTDVHDQGIEWNRRSVTTTSSPEEPSGAGYVSPSASSGVVW